MAEDNNLNGAVRNGIERGQSIDSIRNSLVNAGYDSIKVEMAMQKNAGNFGGQTVATAPMKEVEVEQIQERPLAQFSETRKLPSNIIITGGRSSKKIIGLFLIFLLLVLAIGGIMIWLFWDQIANALV